MGTRNMADAAPNGSYAGVIPARDMKVHEETTDERLDRLSLELTVWALAAEAELGWVS